MNKINILLTAIGGDIGYSIYKILKEQNFINDIICTDISNNNAGANICNNFELISRADSEEYIYDLEKLIYKYDINLIIPTSEPELRFFHKNRIDKIKSAKVLKASYGAMEIGFDKYKTYEFLKENGLPYPWTDKIKPKSLPCILKDPTGCGSKGICLLENENDLEYYSKKYPDYMFQEYIDGEEYTCGLYRYNNDIRTIIFRRTLENGVTKFGELVFNSNIENLMFKIAEKMNLKGSINIQLRIKDEIPYIFEINPRFSSTVLFRDKLGFHDLVWSINDIFNIINEKYNLQIKQAKFYRIYDEVIKSD